MLFVYEIKKKEFFTSPFDGDWMRVGFILLTNPGLDDTDQSNCVCFAHLAWFECIYMILVWIAVIQLRVCCTIDLVNNWPWKKLQTWKSETGEENL